jgi:hypothetical protein
MAADVLDKRARKFSSDATNKRIKKNQDDRILSADRFEIELQS